MSGYRERVEAALADGWAFGGLHAAADGSVVRALLVGPGGETRLETGTLVAGTVPTLVDLAPAGWDEREAADLHRIRFDGHEPLRPLVDHAGSNDRWTVRVRGEDPYEVAVGPVHAGVIESGHFRIHAVGDRILHVDVRLFYKHRGLERAAEGVMLEDGIAYASRACAACAVANGVSYAHACEEALGLEATPGLARARTILLELERVWNHLNDVAAVCSGTGLAAGSAWFLALTERARRLNARLAGHRLLFGSVRVGGSALALDGGAVGVARAELEALRDDAARGWREIAFNASFEDRLPGIGVLDASAIVRVGAVGPAARAAGVADDVRSCSPRLAYDGFEPVVPGRADGDVQARLEQRALELEQSFALLDGLLAAPVVPAEAAPAGRERDVGIGRVESPRGATSCVVEREGGTVVRLRLRTGSYANWPAVAAAATGDLLPDFPLVNKSFELCYACVDR